MRIFHLRLPVNYEENEPYEFAELATYNSERARGIVHTPEWVRRMEAEQERFDRQCRVQFSEFTWSESSP